MIYLIRIAPDTDYQLDKDAFYSEEDMELLNAGEIYGVQVLDKNGKNVHEESVWGYFGLNHAEYMADLKARELEEQGHEVVRLWEWK